MQRLNERIHAFLQAHTIGIIRGIMASALGLLVVVLTPVAIWHALLLALVVTATWVVVRYRRIASTDPPEDVENAPIVSPSMATWSTSSGTPDRGETDQTVVLNIPPPAPDQVIYENSAANDTTEEVYGHIKAMPQSERLATAAALPAVVAIFVTAIFLAFDVRRLEQKWIVWLVVCLACTAWAWIRWRRAPHNYVKKERERQVEIKRKKWEAQQLEDYSRWQRGLVRRNGGLAYGETLDEVDHKHNWVMWKFALIPDVLAVTATLLVLNFTIWPVWWTLPLLGISALVTFVRWFKWQYKGTIYTSRELRLANRLPLKLGGKTIPAAWDRIVQCIPETNTLGEYLGYATFDIQLERESNMGGDGETFPPVRYVHDWEQRRRLINQHMEDARAQRKR